MKYYKDGKSIEYELVINDKYPYVEEIKNKVVYLNVRKKHDKEEVNKIIDRYFNHWYSMIYDKEYKKFYGKKVVHYLGKPYFAKTKKSNKDEMIIDKDTITIYCKNDTHTQHKAIYRRYLKKAVEQTIVKLYFDVQNDFKDIKIPKIIVKGLKSKKCFGYNKWNEIAIELDLGRYDEKYIKVVLYHELCHFYEIEHSDRFYKILDQKLENGSKIDKELDTIIYLDEF